MFRILYSREASQDLNNLFQTIIVNYQAPETAYRYTQEIIDTIKSIAKAPEIYAIQTRKSLQKYGYNVRRVNYKKMAIIYTVYNNVVLIHRIVPSALITEL